MKTLPFPEKKLVLVVGAGASREVGLPMGAELKSHIARALDIRYEFGHRKISGSDLIDQARLRTFSESTDEAISDISRIRSVVKSAQKLAFLGFSFNQQNMDILFPGDGVEPVETKSFGTAYGLSNSDVETISEQLNLMAGIPPARIRLEQELTCAKLFKEYGRALSLR